MSIETVNPYANHSQLSDLEGQVLWEYAKLADKIKRIAALARDTAENPNEPLLADLRELEKKMKLVLTLYRTSVWMIIQDNEMQAEAAAQQAALAEAQHDLSAQVDQRERGRHDEEMSRRMAEGNYEWEDDSTVMY